MGPVPNQHEACEKTYQKRVKNPHEYVDIHMKMGKIILCLFINPDDMYHNPYEISKIPILNQKQIHNLLMTNPCRALINQCLDFEKKDTCIYGKFIRQLLTNPVAPSNNFTFRFMYSKCWQ